MSLQEQQNFLARLYTDTELRRDFLSAPEKIGIENHLTVIEIKELAAILPEELNFFAETLYWKRLREVEKLLPLTKEFLKEDFANFFRTFSENFNPQSLKKHLEDAIGFCDFLHKAEVSEIIKDIAKFERTKIEFFGYGKYFAFCRINHKIEEICRKGENEQKKSNYLWLKIGNKIKHYNL